MEACLKIGNHLLTGEQLVSSLVRYKLLESLIGHVVLDDVLPQVRLTQEEVIRALTGLDQIPEDFDGFLMQWCESKGVSPVYVKTVVLRDLQIRKLKRLLFADRIEAEFLRCKQDLDQVGFRRIKVTDLALAEELYFQIRDDGADFSVLAQQYSQDFERHTGGLIGPVRFSTLPGEIASLFRSGKVGEVYGPVQVQDSFWIVQPEQFIFARLNDSVRTELIEHLFMEWLRSQIQSIKSLPNGVQVQGILPHATTKGELQ